VVGVTVGLCMLIAVPEITDVGQFCIAFQAIVALDTTKDCQLLHSSF